LANEDRRWSRTELCSWSKWQCGMVARIFLLQAGDYQQKVQGGTAARPYGPWVGTNIGMLQKRKREMFRKFPFFKPVWWKYAGGGGGTEGLPMCENERAGGACCPVPAKKVSCLETSRSGTQRMRGGRRKKADWGVEFGENGEGGFSKGLIWQVSSYNRHRGKVGKSRHGEEIGTRECAAWGKKKKGWGGPNQNEQGTVGSLKPGTHKSSRNQGSSILRGSGHGQGRQTRRNHFVTREKMWRAKRPGVNSSRPGVLADGAEGEDR